MAVPKGKTSKAMKRKRRTHKKIAVPELNTCRNCGEFKLSHRVCSNCGYYDGKQMEEVAE